MSPSPRRPSRRRAGAALMLAAVTTASAWSGVGPAAAAESSGPPDRDRDAVQDVIRDGPRAWGSVVIGARARRVPLPLGARQRPVVNPPATTSAEGASPSGGEPIDLVSVHDVGLLDSATAELAHGAARRAGAASADLGSLGVGLVEHRRGTRRLDDIAAGWAIPMAVSVLDPEVATPVFGVRVGGTIGWGGVVLSETAAGLRRAEVGDRLGFAGAQRSTVSFAVGAILPDEVVGGAEVIMSSAAAARLGPIRTTRVLIWGARSRAALETALDSSGLADRHETRIRRSWDPPDPDATLGLLSTKVRLGEFRYRVRDDGTVVLDGGWIAQHITDGGERRTYPGVGVRTACHVVVARDLEAAFMEIAAAGLADAIDLANTNRYGGCFYPRFNRIAGALGVLSRHSWGMALDVNTVTNAQGSIPQLDCRVVVIMRRHGFAWGGNFTRPDGMHFEWVGERRDLLDYPSRYCPNPALDTSGPSEPAPELTQRSVLLAESLTGFEPTR